MINQLSRYKFKKIQYFKILLIISYTICILSISTDYRDLIILKNKEYSISNIINFSRQFSMVIIFIITSCHIFFLFIKRKINLIQNSIFLLSIFYFLFQIVGLVFTENNFENITYITSALTLLNIIFLYEYYYSLEDNYFIYVLSIILFAVLMASLPRLLIPFLIGEGLFYGANFSDSHIFVDKTAPRSSGIARTLVILMVLIHMIFYNQLRKNKFLSYFINIFTIVFIFSLQSRIAIGMFIIVFLALILLDNKINFKNIIRDTLIYIFTPIMILIIINGIHSFNYHKKNNPDQTLSYSIKKDFITNDTIRGFTGFSSGRLNDWSEIINEFSNSNNFEKLFGFGSQGIDLQ